MSATRTFRHNRPLGHDLVDPQGRPVRPIDAASLILWRTGPDGPEVLMGRRHRRARFVPDAFVFPGGKVDRADRAARPARPLDPAHPPRMAVRGSNAFARALAMAAVRETFEETGLMLGAPGDPGTDRPDVAVHPSWAEIGAAGTAPDLSALSYAGRAITSPYSPIRFHARFFIADAAAATGRLGGSGELSDLGWYPIAHALTKLPMVDVTEFMLGEVQRRSEGETEPPPLFAYRRNVPYVRYGA